MKIACKDYVRKLHFGFRLSKIEDDFLRSEAKRLGKSMGELIREGHLKKVKIIKKLDNHTL